MDRWRVKKNRSESEIEKARAGTCDVHWKTNFARVVVLEGILNLGPSNINKHGPCVIA